MVDIKVCVGTSCHLKGSYNIVMTFQQLIEDKGLHDKVDVQLSFCTGNCQKGVCVTVNDALYSVSPETARRFFNETILPAVG